MLDFLSELFSDGHSYSQINTASSALSSIITINKVPCGKHPDAMLLCMVSGGQRMQTVHLTNLKDIKYVGEQVFIPIMQKIKQSKPGNHIYPLSFKTYPKDTKLCVVADLKRYIELTQDLRSSDKLFISYTKPHQAISRDTISRWCKTVMELNGIDIQKYSTHSTRSAASSEGKSMGISLKNIKCAGWKSEKTFTQHYDKLIEEELDSRFQ